MKSFISLLTDLGETYAGIMQGVIYSINPHAQIINITHSTPDFDIEAACLLINNVAKYMPKGCINLVVVDPQVGSERKAIIIQNETSYFVGPDNGVFSLVLTDSSKIFKIENEKYFLKEVSKVFHGRDIFSPVAAYLSLGTKVTDFGKELQPKDIKLINLSPIIHKDKIIGKIVYIDKFGNLITNITKDILTDKEIKLIEVGKFTIKGDLKEYYSQVEEGEVLGLIGSFGYLEVAINKGSAKDILNIKKNQDITVYLS
jgi:S-adenosylmethionine hydrolase